MIVIRGRWILLMILLLGTMAAWVCARPGAVRYEKTRMNGVLVELIRVEIGSAKVKPALAQGSQGTLEGFRSFMQRTHPSAATNGGYFHPNGMPTGDIVIDGKLVTRGAHRAGFCIGKDGRPFIRVRAHGAPHEWPGCQSVLCAGPVLLRNGRPDLRPESEGFNIRSLRVEAVRTAIGIEKDGNLILAVTRGTVTLEAMAEIMRKLGARDAINFDGGGSTALYYNGKVLNEPAARLSNVLLVYGR